MQLQLAVEDEDFDKAGILYRYQSKSPFHVSFSCKGCEAAGCTTLPSSVNFGCFDKF